MRLRVSGAVLVILAAACSSSDHASPSEDGSAAAGHASAASCPDGFLECDGDPASVCETSVRSDPKSCGACGAACPAGANQAPSCKEGVCEVTCLPPFADCNGDASDGCEVDLSSTASHCGTCDRACAGSACVNAACAAETLAGGLASPYAIVADGDYVYVTLNGTEPTRTDCGVVRIAKSGGPALPIATGPVRPLGQIAVSATHVYWTTTDPADAHHGTLQRAPKEGGAPETVFDGSAPRDVAVDGGYVYFSSGLADDAKSAIYRVPEGASGPPETLATGFQGAQTLSVGDGNVWFVTSGPSPFDDGEIDRVPASGGARVTLYTGLRKPGYVMDRDATNLYVQSFTDGTVAAFPLDGGDPKVLATGEPRGFAVDAGTMWFTTTTGFVARVPVTGGEPVQLFSGGTLLRDLALDEAAIYWVDEGDAAKANGKVQRLAR